MGSSFKSQSFIQDQEDVFNLYLERSESKGATSPQSLLPTPGVQELSEAAESPGRGNFALKIPDALGLGNDAEIQILVIGDTVYLVAFAGGGLNPIGTVAVDDNPATICSNGTGGNQIFITSGGNGYIFDLAASTFTEVRTGSTTQGGYLDGYFLAFDAATSTFYVSDLFDGATWDPTQFAQRSIAPDPWVSMIVSNRYINLFGSETSEVWYNAGTFPFPFAPHPSGFMQYGCCAAFSPAVADGAVSWLGSSNQGRGFVMRMAGFSPQIISTTAMQYAMSQYNRIDDAKGWTYTENGHTFYILTLIQANVTWCWDASTQEWHKRGFWDSASMKFDAYRPQWHAFAFGQHTVLDRETGSFYRLSSSLGTDVDGGPIVRERTGPAVVKENQRLYFGKVELLMDVGLGEATGDAEDTDPQVMLQWSNDGGRTWGNEVWRSFGMIGQYGIRVFWAAVGQARKRVFRVRTSTRIPTRIVDMFFELGNGVANG